MAFNRVSAMGVQHGQISPEDEMAANLMRQAQMSALRGSMPSPAPMGQATPELPTPKESEILNSVGRPAYETDYANRQAGYDRQMQEMKGNQAANVETIRQAPQNTYADLKVREYNEAAPERDLNLRKGGIEADLEAAKAAALRATIDQGGAPALNVAQGVPVKDPEAIAMEKMKSDAARLELEKRQREMEQAKAEEDAAALESQGQFGAANDLRTKAHLPAHYRDTQGVFSADPELMSATGRLKNMAAENTGFYPAMLEAGDLNAKYNPFIWLTGGAMKQDNLGSYRYGVDQRVSSQINQIAAMAKRKGLNPEQTMAYILQMIRPQMGATYLPGSNSR
jgi:hypothetical protein